MPQVCNALIELGVSCNYKGFLYLAYAVKLGIDCPERLLLITKWLYPDIAKRFGTTPACVEKNIRTSIQRAWASGSSVLARQTGWTTHPPTNAQVITMLCHRLFQIQFAA